MARKPESRLQKRTQRLLQKEFGGFFFKVSGGMFQMAGVPDLVGCVEGLFFGFELKMEGEKPKPLQIEIMRRIIEDGGGIASVIYDPQEAVDIVRKAIKDKARPSSARSRRLRI